MSLLEIICKELGVEVGEEWLGSDGFKYKITREGVLIFIEVNTNPEIELDYFEKIDDISRLLTGKLKPVWRPKEGERYYCPRIDVPHLSTIHRWEGLSSDEYRYENDMVFRYRGQAGDKAREILKLMRK